MLFSEKTRPLFIITNYPEKYLTSWYFLTWANLSTPVIKTESLYHVHNIQLLRRLLNQSASLQQISSWSILILSSDPHLGIQNGKFPLRNLEQGYVQIFGAFEKFRKATIFLIMSVCPSARMETFSPPSTDFHEIWVFHEYVSRKCKFY